MPDSRMGRNKSQTLKADLFQIKGFDGEDLEKAFREHWARKYDQFPAISKVIRYRIATAMTLRRKRILYSYGSKLLV